MQGMTRHLALAIILFFKKDIKISQNIYSKTLLILQKRRCYNGKWPTAFWRKKNLLKQQGLINCGLSSTTGSAEAAVSRVLPMLWRHTGILTTLGYLIQCSIFIYSTSVWSRCEDFCDVVFLPLFHYHLHVIAKELPVPKIWQMWIFSIPCSSSKLFNVIAGVTL